MDILRQVLGLLMVSATARGLCDVGWDSYGPYCYLFSTEETDFETASARCHAWDAALVDPEDAKENYFLYSMVVHRGDNSYWIGLRRVLGNLWRWVDSGQAATYDSWDLGEPDGEGSCARITPYGVGMWRDMKCDQSLPYICKKPADCGVPPSLSNSNITTSREPFTSLTNQTIYLQGTRATYRCDEGYEFTDLTAAKVSECAYGGSWSPDVSITGACQGKVCKPPPQFKNSYYNGSEQDYPYGTVISYRCDAGFRFNILEFNITKYLTCGETKQWLGDTVQDCSPLYCQRPVTTSAYANTSFNDEGTVASYECDDGYKFTDNTTVKVFTCLDDYWQPPGFECIRKRCLPYSVENASPSTNLTYTGTSVVFSCDKGRQYPDTATRKTMTCKSNEEWDRPITETCERKRCLDPPPNSTETRTHNWNASLTYKYEDAIVYTCIEGWVFMDKEQSTTRKAQCNQDGIWAPAIISECVGDPIEVVTKYHPPVEEESAPVIGSIGYIFAAIVIVILLVLDLSTIGKHIAVMKANIKNDTETLKKQARERKRYKEKVDRWKNQGQHPKHKKYKTVIVTDNYLKKLAQKRAANHGELNETERLVVEDEVNSGAQPPVRPEDDGAETTAEESKQKMDAESAEQEHQQRENTEVKDEGNRREPSAKSQAEPAEHTPPSAGGATSRASQEIEMSDKASTTTTTAATPPKLTPMGSKHSISIYHEQDKMLGNQNTAL